MEIKKNIANFITSIRLLGAIAIIFLNIDHLAFYIVYTLCGLSDAIDGFIARKLHITSKFGTKLDSVADLTFYTVMMIKLLPKLIDKLMLFNWVILITALAIRVFVYIFAAVRFHKFSSLHTILNKITGGGVFLIPYFILLAKPAFNVYGLLVNLIAVAAAVEEIIYYCRKAK